ncbi:DNA glycosylase [Durotheca rogersii]|uniref:DNA glycosylase n=1 Tax=Durotheca rogersii TaxID=419775 RepID=UPI0022206D3D|nr:DNA glycosylase [Durotheca rogersii]KAI5867803.1 DNA glycosylase [Durotheca rogersii]
MHDDVRAQAPEVIPAPSLEVAGCGEVPSVLDALIRTVLSGATTFENADKMIKGLTKKFGVLTEGIGEGSIDWNNVRTSPIEDLVGAIRCGGLGNAKAKSIKGILDMVYQENIERREAYLREKQTGEQADVFAAADKTKGQKDLEILKTDKNILSLDHIHGLPADEAMRQFTKYPGVGVKTSACVILFCLQRPCFAVDTHVNKFSKWLGWAPEKATEDDVFSHLEVRCPDHLKYGLHQLFIRHGQTCEKCRRSTAEGTDSWRKLEECPLESLLNRYDKRQSKAKPKPPKKAKGEKPEAEPDVKKEEQEDGADTTGAKNGPAEDGMEAGDQVEEGSEAKEDDDIKKEGEA